MSDLLNIASKIHSAILSLHDNCGQIQRIREEFRTLHKSNLDAEIDKIGFGSVENFLNAHPEIFIRNGDTWRVARTGNVPNHARSVEETRTLLTIYPIQWGTREFGDRGGRGGHGGHGYPSSRGGRGGRGGFGNCERDVHPTSSSPWTFGGTTYYVDPNSIRSWGGPGQPISSGNMRIENMIDGREENRTRFSNSGSASQNRNGSSDQDGHNSSRHNNQNVHCYNRSAHRHSYHIRWNRQDTNTSRNRIVEENNLLKQCERIISVLKQHEGKLLRDYELIRFANDGEFSPSLSTTENNGPTGFLLNCIERQPEIMKNVVIVRKASNDGVNRVWLKSEDGADENPKVLMDIERKKIERNETNDPTGLLGKLSNMMKDEDECSGSEAVERIDIDGETRNKKFLNLYMAISNDKTEKEFKVELKDGSSVISRREWEKEDELLKEPSPFGAKLYHPWIEKDVQLVELHREHLVRVVRMESLSSDFFVIVEKDYQAYDDMMDKIQIAASQYKLSLSSRWTSYKENDACLVRKSNGVWYRGVVNKLNTEENLTTTVEVQLVDIGSIETFDTKHMLPMSQTHANIQPFGLRCRLKLFRVPDDELVRFKEAETSYLEILKKDGVQILLCTRYPKSHIEVELEFFDGSPTLTNLVNELLRKFKIEFC